MFYCCDCHVYIMCVSCVHREINAEIDKTRFPAATWQLTQLCRNCLTTVRRTCHSQLETEVNYCRETRRTLLMCVAAGWAAHSQPARRSLRELLQPRRHNVVTSITGLWPHWSALTENAPIDSHGQMYAYTVARTHARTHARSFALFRSLLVIYPMKLTCYTARYLAAAHCIVIGPVCGFVCVFVGLLPR